MDFTSGLIAGIYMPLQAKANGYDCQSRFINEAIMIITLASNFDKPFSEKTAFGWFSFGISMTIHSYAIYRIVVVCAEENRESKVTQFYENFNFLKKAE